MQHKNLPSSFTQLGICALALMLSACTATENPSSSSAVSSVAQQSSAVAISSAMPASSSQAVSSSSMAPVASSSSVANIPSITLQENQAGFCHVDGTVDNDNGGFTGSGFANTDNAQNQSIIWSVNAAQSGMVEITIRFANGGGSARSGDLLVNGGSNGSHVVTLADTGAWTTWVTETITVDLVQGENTLQLRSTTSAGLANIDSLTIKGAGVSPAACTQASSSAANSSAQSSAASSAPNNQPAQCQAMGWATRNGRSSQPFNVTGGGNATPVVVRNFSDLQKEASGSTPKVIHIDGTVGSGWSGRSGDRLSVGSNKTIIGLRPGTLLRAPIHIKDSSNVIVRNIVIQGPGSNSEQAWDNINIEGNSKNVWIDHCEFWNGQDGNADVVKGADNVTFTWNIFGYTTDGGHNFSNLVASSDNEPVSEGKLNITLMFNHFKGVAQRQPRCRYGNIHVVNNLFTKDGMTSQNGISAGVECRVLIENNHFIGIQHPVHERSGGVSELRGNNIFENTSGDKSGYGGKAFEPPYDYSSYLVNASEVKGMLEGKVGATLTDPANCK